MASYPGNIHTFTTKVDNTDLVLAAHVNVLQDEVIAIQTAGGTNPATGTNTYTSSGFTVGTSHLTLAARLTNLEVGIVGDSHSQYVKVAGGSTITAASSSTKGVVIKGASSQSANLLEVQNSGGTVLASISAAGGITDTKLTPDLNNLYVMKYVFG
jgi:hypothetical protein